jgi:DNA-binding NarL/FixJ family response regulator
MIRVLIMDDQPISLAGLLNLFDGTNISVCAHADSLERLLVGLDRERPQVVVGEIQLGDHGIIERLPILRQKIPNLPVLFYSASDNPLDEARAFSEGANGYLCRTKGRDDLIGAIVRIAGGTMLWTGADQRRLSNYLRDGRVIIGHFAPLTPREKQILIILTTGATNREISEALSISHETVKEHVQHVLKKIGVNDRTQAAVWAVRNGLA